MHIWFPQMLVLLWKRSAAPLRPPKIIYFCKFRLKFRTQLGVNHIRRVWNYPYLACKIQNFLRQGGAAPPRQGASPLHPRENLAQALGLLGWPVRSWATNVENLPELMLYSLFYVPYLLWHPLALHDKYIVMYEIWKTWLCYIKVSIYIHDKVLSLSLYSCVCTSIRAFM